ncbi:MAG: DUF4350 domain-containing protein [Proteobacteria bacterium]|nr:DUF4350 domain-containing protein [Pseudomonadota bacterium]
MGSKRGYGLILLILFALFTGGLVRLFTLRFESGDIYPPYSTLRSDPLGCRVFHDSLVHLEGLVVTRNQASLQRFHEKTPSTLFFIGDRAEGENTLPDAMYQALSDYLDSGGRIVVCLYSSLTKGCPDDPDTPDGEEVSDDGDAPPAPHGGEAEQDEETPGEDPVDDVPLRARTVDLCKAWGFRYDYVQSDQTGHMAAVQDTYRSVLGSEDLPWHSTLFFTDLDPEWQEVSRLSDSAVLIERPVGKGSLVLCSDSYLLSNEGLKNDLRPGFLTWLTGQNQHIIFDESHLGIRSQPGIASLVRTYGLHGVFASFLLVALIFIWKNASFFVPPSDNLPRTRAVSDRDHASGLSSLFKRHIPPKDLLGVCIKEWGKSFVSNHEASKAFADKLNIITTAANTMASGRDHDPVAGYREIHRLLSEGKKP